MQAGQTLFEIATLGVGVIGLPLVQPPQPGVDFAVSAGPIKQAGAVRDTQRLFERSFSIRARDRSVSNRALDWVSWPVWRHDERAPW